MTDAEFLLSVLEDCREHTLTEILQRSFRERGCGLTVHSRASDLRRRGYEISNSPMPRGQRGSVYRLQFASEPHPVSPPSAAASGPDEPSAGCVLSAAPTGGPRASEGPLEQLALEVPVTSREREAA